MAKFPSLPDRAKVMDVVARFPDRGPMLLQMADNFLRGPSELSVAERETIFAYGSAINDCTYCHTSHKYTAAEFGVDEALWGAILADLDTAPIDDRLRAILAYVRKLTLAPATMTEADVHAVFAAGVSEEALFDAICVCAFNNLMNRVVDATGLVGTDDEHRESGRRLSTIGYKVPARPHAVN